MKRFLLYALVTIFLTCVTTSCNQNSPEDKTSGIAKTNTQIMYKTEVEGVSGSVPYNGELTDSQIMSIYNMALSTYGDRGLYHYITFSEAKTEEQVKTLAIEFGKKADNMVRSQYSIPGDVWKGYSKLIFRVSYVYDGNIITVASYDYLH